MRAILSCLHTNIPNYQNVLIVNRYPFVYCFNFLGVFLERYIIDFCLFLEFIKGDSVPGCVPFCHVYIQIVPKCSNC